MMVAKAKRSYQAVLLRRTADAMLVSVNLLGRSDTPDAVREYVAGFAPELRRLPARINSGNAAECGEAHRTLNRFQRTLSRLTAESVQITEPTTSSQRLCGPLAC
jgi:hypothetical protein